MGRTLLASQFASGLKPAIKRRVTGSEQPNDIEQLLAKARFEEAKLHELRGTEPRDVPSSNYGVPSKQLCSSTPTRTEQNVKKRFGPSHPPPGQHNHVKCFNCGGMRHLARECKWRTKRVEQELRPKPVNHNPRLSTITAKP